LTTWLVSGFFEDLLQRSLPYHTLHTQGTWDIALEVLSASATYLAFLVIAIGAAFYLLRNRLVWLSQIFRPVTGFVERGVGFEWMNQQVINVTVNSAAALCKTQTGHLNWNVVGIIVTLIILLSIML